MTDINSNVIEFQCPNCGNDLKQTIGQLKAEKHMICPGCGIGINVDTDRLANAADEIQKAIEKSPPEITIKLTDTSLKESKHDRNFKGKSVSDPWPCAKEREQARRHS